MILSQFNYFAKFVPIEALKKIFANPEHSQLPGYAETKAEILNAPSAERIDGITNYVFSYNEEFVSDRVKNNKGTMLFVEYGKVSFAPNVADGVRETLALSIVRPYNTANNDNLNETLLMQQTLDMLKSILTAMLDDQRALDACGIGSLINFPAEILPVEPKYFFGNAGWMAVFERSETLLR